MAEVGTKKEDIMLSNIVQSETKAETETKTEIKKRWDLKIILAFLAIYLVWGSVFLAVRIAIESIPPLLLVALRCLGGGIVLYAWVKLRLKEKLGWRHWRNATVGGFCFFVLSQGYVAWSEQFVPSGITAVMVALIPLWIVLLEWWRPGGKEGGGSARPNKLVLFGIVVGFAGMLLLVGPGLLNSGASVNTVATLFLSLAALAWALGIMYNRYRPTDASPAAMSALQLLTSGAIMLVLSSLSGDWGKMVGQPLKGEAIIALIYLVVAATVVTFSAFVWLVQKVSPTQVSTYAYVNPVVALLLGFLFAGEVLTFQDLLACLVILAGVVIIITFQRRS